MPYRILFVDTVNFLGGAEISLLTLIEHLDKSVYHPYLLTRGEGPLSETAGHTGISVMCQEFPWFRKRKPWQYPLSILELIRTIRTHRVDLIHTNCDHSLNYVAWASSLTGVPFVSHVRDLVRTWFDPNNIAVLNRAQRVIANSKAVAQACVEAGIDEKKIVTIYNPVDVDVFQQVNVEHVSLLRGELGISNREMIIGLVGQIQPIKGHGEFIEASLRLVTQSPNLHVMVVGAVAPGESNQLFYDRLLAAVATSEHANRFHFIGYRKDVSVVMKAIDILAIPSWREPFGRVAVEGLAAGCAVIGTKAGGLPEIITDEVDGLLITPKDSDALFVTLRQLTLNENIRRQLSQAGPHSAQRFRISYHVDQIQALYRDHFRSLI